jgi:NADH dehydrogenase
VNLFSTARRPGTAAIHIPRLRLVGRSFFIEGLLARIMYRSLRLLHEWALGGTTYALLSLVVRAPAHRTGPQVKLH